jgi:hypothetical protein
MDTENSSADNHFPVKSSISTIEEVVVHKIASSNDQYCSISLEDESIEIYGYKRNIPKTVIILKASF